MPQPMTKREIQDLFTRADSYLSLLWHRYVPPDRKTDITLRIEVERTINDLRHATQDWQSEQEASA